MRTIEREKLAEFAGHGFRYAVLPELRSSSSSS